MKKLILTSAAVAAMCFTMAVSASAMYVEGQETPNDSMMHIMSVETGIASDSVSSGVADAYPGVSVDLPVSSDGYLTNMPVVDAGAPQSIDPVQPAVGLSEEEARKLAAEGGLSGSVGGGVSEQTPPDYAVTYDLPVGEVVDPIYAPDAPLMDKSAMLPVSDENVNDGRMYKGAEDSAEGEMHILAENGQEDALLSTTSVSDNTQLWFTIIGVIAALAVSLAALMVVRKKRAVRGV
ncbi:MAG: LPXTG cell wall anchor domain-containing protein [Eubacteriales bacterium]